MRWLRPVFRAARTLKDTPLSSARRRKLRGGCPWLVRTTFTLASKTRSLHDMVKVSTSFFSYITIAKLLLDVNTLLWLATTYPFYKSIDEKKARIRPSVLAARRGKSRHCAWQTRRRGSLAARKPSG